MKRILINATHNEEIRVALCKDNHLYDFDLENRTREQKKSNIYKAVVTRVEQSLEAVFVDYGSARQGFLPLREIAPEYLSGNPREDGLKQLIKEGDQLIIQIEKEERGNKGAAVSTYISLAGSYLVLMPNNAKGGGISRQINGKVRDEMRNIVNELTVPKGMSVIIRTAGICKSFEELQNDLSHLLSEWQSILDKNKKPTQSTLLHQEAGIVTRAMRDYLRDDVGEVWIDSENAYNEAVNFIEQVMPSQLHKLRKYTSIHPMFTNFGVERQIETAYQREVRLPSGGSIVIDQTEALVSIDINSAKSTKGSDVAETAYHTNLEAADEIARQLRLRDMGGLIVIDFIDMSETQHQKDVEKRLIDATRYDRARVQFAEISKFGLMQMSRQRLRPSLDEATGYICPRCHGNGMIRDLRSLALSIMRQIEQVALHERSGEVQVDVPTEIAAFLLNEKRESLVYLEQDSGTRITILPHAHLESPNFTLQFNPDGYAPATYDRITDVEEKQTIERGYDANWHTEKPQQSATNHWQKDPSKDNQQTTKKPTAQNTPPMPEYQPQAVAWLSNLFAPKAQAKPHASLDNQDIALAIESIINNGGQALGASAQLNSFESYQNKAEPPKSDKKPHHKTDTPNNYRQDKRKDPKTDTRYDNKGSHANSLATKNDKQADTKYPKREAGSTRQARHETERGQTLKAPQKTTPSPAKLEPPKSDKKPTNQAKPADKPISHDKTNHNKADYDKADHKVANRQNTAGTQNQHQANPKSLPAENTPAQEHKTQSEKPQALAVRIQKCSDKIITSKVIHLSLGKLPNTHETATSHATDKPSACHDTLDTHQSQAYNHSPTDHTPASDSTANTNAPIDDTPEPKSDVAQTSDVVNQQDNTQSLPIAPQACKLADTDTDIDIDNVDVADINTVHAEETKNQIATNKPKILAASDEKLTQIAKQLNLAKNDPRVVKQAFNLPICGSAGAFIHQHLADAKNRLDKDGFVACFVEATKHQQSSFSFANYGFSPLSGEFVAGFLKTTHAVAKTGIPQGKTNAQPTPIGVRAKNDPRGEFVYQDEHAATDDKQAVHDKQSVHIDEQSVDAHSIASPAQVNQTTSYANELLAHGVSDDLDNKTQPDDMQSDDVQNDDRKDNKTHTGDDDLSFDLTKEIIEHIMQSASDDKKTAQDANKASISDYKNKLENVAKQFAEQLLPPSTGFLGLINPKTSNKVKIRKPATTKAKDTKKRGKKEVVSAVIIKKDEMTNMTDNNQATDSQADNNQALTDKFNDSPHHQDTLECQDN